MTFTERQANRAILAAKYFEAGEKSDHQFCVGMGSILIGGLLALLVICFMVV